MPSKKDGNLASHRNATDSLNVKNVSYQVMINQSRRTTNGGRCFSYSVVLLRVGQLIRADLNQFVSLLNGHEAQKSPLSIERKRSAHLNDITVVDRTTFVLLLCVSLLGQYAAVEVIMD